MNLTYLGHACFLVEAGGKRILFDPFITGNPLAAHINVSSLRCDYILVSHGHNDHVGDLEAIAANNPDVVVVAIAEISGYYGQKGLNTHPMNKGGWWTFDFGRVKMVHAVHSSSLPDGSYGGEPAGFVLDTPDGVRYFAGDTALTMDMQLIPMTCPPLTAAILPIGSNFTMDYHDARIAADLLQCKRVIGCHYDTFGYIKIDHHAAIAHFADHNRVLILPTVGEPFSLS
jgi:L-ascorbate metabolism protein UlaG (beta-lactamase superfamily)